MRKKSFGLAGTVAAKLTRVSAVTVLSGKLFQSFVVAGKKEDCLSVRSVAGSGQAVFLPVSWQLGSTWSYYLCDTHERHFHGIVLRQW